MALTDYSLRILTLLVSLAVTAQSLAAELKGAKNRKELRNQYDTITLVQEWMLRGFLEGWGRHAKVRQRSERRLKGCLEVLIR